ncbi:PAS domain-containing sensor histidine kinase [Microvirga sp. BT688]|uniref:PAS domain-containing sensor histidine kinase n=1 Tax=Microvirga sp. TaxID=1873136 RepID=UPI0016845DAF|nr:PAS domain-containing sensor histidine kinase [Microvirga sp.]MBD2746960.1 PAS domain-containing sensor histidine kinase [Microvirga sp.]
MTGGPDPFEHLMARLAAEPALGLLAEPGAIVFIWDRAGERLLWTFPDTERLRGAFTEGFERVTRDLRTRERIKALAGGLAPSENVRVERLRLDPARPWLPVACACRLAALENGEAVLVTAFTGSTSRVARSRALQAADGNSRPQQQISEILGDPAPGAGQTRGTIRFVWQADAQTRFTEVSPELAQTVGPVAADIIGRTWDEVCRSVVEDSDGAVADLFARRDTWSGRTVFWNIDNAPLQVPVDWAGMPVFSSDRALIGFRGFGLLRMDAAREREAIEKPVEDEGSNRADLIAQSLVPDDTFPFRPPEEMPSQEPENDASDEENWFTNLREQVAEALSSTAAPEPAPQRKLVDRPPPGSTLSDAERNAFREIARALGARLEDASSQEKVADQPDETAPATERDAPSGPADAPASGDPILDRLPIGILIHRGERILFANRFLLDLTGYETIEQIRADGGLVHLFRGSPALGNSDEEDTALALTARSDENIAVKVRASSAEWEGREADLLVIRRASNANAQPPAADSRVHELEAILDTATDGVIVLDETGRILSLNRSAEALFGYDERAVAGDAITVLLAPESHIVALDYLERLRSPGVGSLLNDGREVLGRERQGGSIPLFMTMGRLGDGPERRFCAVLRDITAFKKTEGELIGAKHAAEEASAQKSDLLAKISHEIRTPLNAILGFAEVMLEERFGPIGNDRYKEYLKDVHASGSHVISLVNDLLDLAKIEAGRLELSFTGVGLNDLVSSCVALLQPQAARDRIVMRMSFAPKLPPVVADERSMRQIVLNLVSNAIKFTDAGGQVIVSTAMTDRGEVAFRVRDTGIGMTPEEVEAALEPFRQLATSRKRGGTGLGLPLTKALVEANKGALQISSQPSEGTLVEVIFPPTRVWAE